MRARVASISYTKKLRIFNILNFLCSVCTDHFRPLSCKRDDWIKWTKQLTVINGVKDEIAPDGIRTRDSCS